MKHFSVCLIVLFLMVQTPVNVKAQSTYAQIYQILNTHCASNSTCHNGGAPTFNVTVSPDSLYRAIINATPLNPAAAAIFNKLIVPGDVTRSFILRKIAHGISDGLVLNQPAEGLDMPNGQPALAKPEIELVRQWILNAAPETGNVVDTAMINTFYRNGGITDTYSPHTPPAPGTGFQIYIGTVFVGPDSDNEWYYKYNPHITAATESWEISTFLPAATHHFVVYNLIAGHDVYFPWGLRPLSENSMNDVSSGLGSTAGLTNIIMPPHTAYFCDQGVILDLDMHIVNPNMDSILATDIYVNILTQPLGTAQAYVNMTNWSIDTLSIAQDGNTHMYSAVANDSTQTNYYKIWKMYSHTHKYGVGFNTWLRNPDGSKGAQIYDGNYSYEDGFNVGYYRWGNHTTVRTFPGDSLFQVDPRLGFIWEASYLNTAGPDPVFYGPTAAQEMDVMGFFGIQGDPLPTAVSTIAEADLAIRVFPNPSADEFVLQYDLASPAAVHVDILDITGNKVANLLTESPLNPGRYTHDFQASDYKLAPGIYFVSFNIGGRIETRKLIIAE